MLGLTYFYHIYVQRYILWHGRLIFALQNPYFCPIFRKLPQNPLNYPFCTLFLISAPFLKFLMFAPRGGVDAKIYTSVYLWPPQLSIKYRLPACFHSKIIIKCCQVFWSPVSLFIFSVLSRILAPKAWKFYNKQCLNIIKFRNKILVQLWA